MCLDEALIQDQSNCGTQAGVAKIFVIPGESVTALTFNADGVITAITIDAGAAIPNFVLIAGDLDTPFMTQEATVANGTNKNVVQTVSSQFSGMNAAKRKAIELLGKCCNIHVVVQDNNGELHYLGVSTLSGGNYEARGLRFGTGSGNTGTNPAGDLNAYIFTLTGNIRNFAPFVLGGANGALWTSVPKLTA